MCISIGLYCMWQNVMQINVADLQSTKISIRTYNYNCGSQQVVHLLNSLGRVYSLKFELLQNLNPSIFEPLQYFAT